MKDKRKLGRGTKRPVALSFRRLVSLLVFEAVVVQGSYLNTERDMEKSSLLALGAALTTFRKLCG